MLLNRTEMIKILTGMVAAHTDGPRKTWSALVPKADPERPSVLDRYVPVAEVRAGPAAECYRVCGMERALLSSLGATCLRERLDAPVPPKKISGLAAAAKPV